MLKSDCHQKDFVQQQVGIVLIRSEARKTSVHYMQQCCTIATVLAEGRPIP